MYSTQCYFVVDGCSWRRPFQESTSFLFSFKYSIIQNDVVFVETREGLNSVFLIIGGGYLDYGKVGQLTYRLGSLLPDHHLALVGNWTPIAEFEYHVECHYSLTHCLT